ncbi:MAG: YkgJ family cysteine cluster protein, partial [Deltaproteobacteria bacterium]|nr:YkgJ family cysteine cluster protein [Deltaproteobacteria bacterium]
MHALGARAIHFYYEDALDRIWLACAERLGLRVIRSPKAYASYDGKGTLTLAPSEALDPDDCLAQMIFHEACHALVQGPEAFFQEDWGLDNTTSRDVVRELACLRVQAQLAQPFGLRKFLAPTTEFRAFYDSLGPDPLEVTESESLFASSSELVESVRLAKVALGRADRPPFHPHL